MIKKVLPAIEAVNNRVTCNFKLSFKSENISTASNK